MDVEADCFVSGALLTVLHVSRFAGIAPLRFVKKKTRWHVSPSMAWSIYGYFLVTVFNIIIIGAVIFELQLDSEKTVRMRNHTRQVVWIVDSSLVMLLAGTAVYGAPGHMKSMIACFNEVQKLNYELNMNHRSMLSEKKKISLFMLWAIFTVVLFSADHGLLMYTINLNNADCMGTCIILIQILYHLSSTLSALLLLMMLYKESDWIGAMYGFYYCCYWIAQLRAMLFIFITLHVMYTFKALNDSLRTLLHDGLTKPARCQQKTIRRVTLVYMSACDVVRTVNQNYGLMALMMLGFYLLHIVVTVYYFINNIIDVNNNTSGIMNNNMRTINVTIQIIWCLFHTLNLLMAVEPCHLTHMEMQTTRQLVGELIIYKHATYEPLEMELELFFRHLLLNQTSYSPLQVTTISRPLLATIFASITTYLAIITQI